MIFLLALLAIALRFVVHGNPDGAPIEACSTLTPQHGANPRDCGVDCPFTLTLEEIDSAPVTVGNNQLPMYVCGSQHKSEFSVFPYGGQNLFGFTVVLRGTGGEIFRGFMIQPRLTTEVFDPNAPFVGEFIETNTSGDVQFLQCGIGLVGELARYACLMMPKLHAINNKQWFSKMC